MADSRPRPTKWQRAIANADAAFFGAGGDSAGLGSELAIYLAGGGQLRNGALGHRRVADEQSARGRHQEARIFRERAAALDARAAAAEAKFAREQARRRHAVVGLGPAQTVGEAIADFGGRAAAATAQPENFVGGPALRGLSLGRKVLTAGGGAAAATLAAEPVVQSSAVRRGTRDALSVKDATVNALLAFGSVGLLGGGTAHGLESWWRKRLLGPKPNRDPGPDIPRPEPPSRAQTVDRRDVPPPGEPGAAPDRTFGGLLAESPRATRDVVRREHVERGGRLGHFGPVHHDLASDYRAAIRRLSEDGDGEVPGALVHPELGPVDLVWGEAGVTDRDGFGLAKIVRRHPEVVVDLPNIFPDLRIVQTPSETGNQRFVLTDDRYRAVVGPDYLGDAKRWLITAFEEAPGNQTTRRDSLPPDGGSTGAELRANIAGAPRHSNPRPGGADLGGQPPRRRGR